ncbi:hypothetical protein [Desulfosporosinus burensis]
MNEKFLGKNLESIEVSSVIDCTVDFGVVEYIDVADDKVSVWGPESRVFWINLNDVLVVDYNPREEGVCVLIEAKNNVEVRFKVV